MLIPGACHYRLNIYLSVFKDEIGIDAEFGVEALCEGHGDSSSATHDLTELGFIDAQ